VVALNSLQDDNALDFSADGLTVYISSQRPGGPGGLDIFSASRASTAVDFGALTPVAGVNTTDHEYNPRISADGLKLFFTAPKGNGHYGTVVATRGSLLTAFGAGAPLVNVGSNADEGGPFLTADGKAIYFSSTRAGGLGGEDIMVADLGTDGSFGTPRFVTELASTAQDANPVLTADGLVVYFSSQRSGVGQAEIYMATRSTVNGAFGTPLPVTELNSAAQDWPAYVSADGCTLYFCSERMAGTSGRTGADIFSATRGQ
jgi:Tol biopolymer transport system component